MVCAILFNSGDPTLSGNYADVVKRCIFKSEIIQKSGRHIKIFVGDVLIFSHAKTKDDYLSLCEKIYFIGNKQFINESKLRKTFLKHTIFAWVVHNITNDIAITLHNFLSSCPGYLGLHPVTFSLPQHLIFYRNFMIPKYRVINRACSIFYSMGDEEDLNKHELDELKTLGFDTADWEDYGARQTIFDDYDTIAHFEQIEDLRHILVNAGVANEDQIDELFLLLEDLNPHLFNSLGAAARSLKQSRHSEDLAQVALSLRRYLSQLADMLVPAQSGTHKDYKLTKDKFCNRLLAYIDTCTIMNDKIDYPKINQLKESIKKAIENVNINVHKEHISAEIISDLIVTIFYITSDILLININNINRPYDAYNEKIKDFALDLINKRYR